MLPDPAAAAWAAAGRPPIAAPSAGVAQCARCGTREETGHSSRIVSESFTGFDAWPYGTRKLCTPCAWAYDRQPTKQPALFITTADTAQYRDGSALGDLLAGRGLAATEAVVVP